jgi:hypothetical protein
MKTSNFNNYILITLLSLISSLSYPALAQNVCPPNTGKVNGSECAFIDCECASDVCVNGTCVQCAVDSDCGAGHCVDNSCH